MGLWWKRISVLHAVHGPPKIPAWRACAKLPHRVALSRGITRHNAAPCGYRRMIAGRSSRRYTQTGKSVGQQKKALNLWHLSSGRLLALLEVVWVQAFSG